MNERAVARAISERFWARVCWMEEYSTERALTVEGKGGKAAHWVKMRFRLGTKSFQKRERGGSGVILERSWCPDPGSRWQMRDW